MSMKTGQFRRWALLVLLSPLAALAASTNTYYVVSGNPSPEPPFATWSNAAADIQTAVNLAVSNLVPGTTECEVVVSNGTYIVTNQVVVSSAITLRSLDGNPSNTTLCGGFPVSTNRCLYASGNAVVDGFTLTNGMAVTSEIDTNFGGGVYVTNAAVLNCVIIGNSVTGTATRGAGVYMVGSSALVSNCLIKGNSGKVGACSGGGAYVGGGLMVDCTITTNNATTVSGGVGGAYVMGAVLRHCLIADGNLARSAGGVLIENGGVVTECTIRNNISSTGSGGAGVTLGGGSILSNSIVTASRGTSSGSALNFGSGGSAIGCLIYGNTANNGVVYMNNGTLRNCLIVGNSVATGAVYMVDNGTIDNCTITRNQAGELAGGFYATPSGDVTMRNTIIYDNVAPSNANFYMADPTADITEYNCSDVLLPAGSNNIVADPLFVSPGFGYGTNAVLGDYTLQQGSPCIGAGTNLSWMATGLALDLAGNSRVRPSWGRVDMGAYEAAPLGGALSNRFTASVTAGVAPLRVVFTGETSGNTNGLVWQWILGDGTTRDWSTDSIVTNTYAARTNAYTVTLNVTNAAGETSTYSGSIMVYPPVAYVATNALHIAPFETWANAATQIQAAVDVAGSGFTAVWVSNGVYTVSSEILMAKDITVRGFSGDWADTVVRGGYPVATNRCFNLTASNAVLEGFTITNGYSVGSTGGGGGGIRMTSAAINTTVQNCLITGNRVSGSATYGGGISANAGRMVNCVVQGNASAENGGGIWSQGTTVVVSNCLVFNNRAGQASGGIQLGGGIMANCTVSNNLAGTTGGGVQKQYTGAGTCRNSLIVGNQAGTQGGGICLSLTGGSANFAVQNCTIAGNAADSGGGIYLAHTNYQALNCIVAGNAAATSNNVGSTNLLNVAFSCSPDLVGGTNGNIAADPKFVGVGSGAGTNWTGGNLRLKASSPCVGTGTNLSWMASAVDPDGNPYNPEAPSMGVYQRPVVQPGTGIMVR